MEQNPMQNQMNDDEIDLFELWATLVDGKVLIIGCSIIFALLATAAAFLMTPKYEAEVTASFAGQEKSGGSLLAGQFGGLAELAGVSLGGSSDSSANYAYLTSRGFIEKFITENQLLPVLFAGNWDEEAKRWKAPPAWQFWQEGDSEPSLWNAYSLFSEKILSVSQDKKTSIITLTVQWKDREQAVAWANGLMKAANETLRQRTIEETQRSLDYLNKELAKTSVVDVQNTIFKVMENQIKTMMMANTQDEFAFKVIDPAMPVDENAYVKPKRPLIIALGFMGGLFLGVVVVFIRKAFKNHKNQAMQLQAPPSENNV